MVSSERERLFRSLYETHYRAVLAYALRRTANLADAHEIVADTFLVAWRRLDDVPSDADALPWLYGVARRVFANAQRSSRRRRLLRQRLAGLAPDPEQFEADVGRDDERGAVVAALRRLKPDDQELLRLVAWEGLAHRQVAQVLGCSENAVAIRLHRARERLAAELAKEPTLDGQRRRRRTAHRRGPGGESDG